MVYLSIVFLIISLAIVVLSSHWIIKSLSKIAKLLKISDYSAAFIILALSTSLPELFVGINAALENNPALSLGNVIGSNLVNLTLIAGLGVVLVGGFKIKSEKTKKDSLMMFFITLAPLILMFIGRQISRIDGIILIGIFITYNYILLRDQRKFTKVTDGTITKRQAVIYPFIFIFSLIILFFASRYAILYAIETVNFLNLAPMIVGLILIALGTSLPELSFTLSSLAEKKSELSLGNLMGSVVANSTLVLGVTAIIMPITANFLIFLISGSFMIFATFLFATFVESGSKLYIKEGISLILLYVVFMVIQIYVPSIL